MSSLSDSKSNSRTLSEPLKNRRNKTVLIYGKYKEMIQHGNYLTKREGCFLQHKDMNFREQCGLAVKRPPGNQEVEVRTPLQPCLHR